MLIDIEIPKLSGDLLKHYLALTPKQKRLLARKYEEHALACFRNGFDAEPLATFLSEARTMDSKIRTEVWKKEKRWPRYQAAKQYDVYVSPTAKESHI